MVKSKINFKFILKYLAIFLFCLLLANGQIDNLSPFLYAFYFACLFVGFNEKLLAIFVLGSAVVVDLSLQSFYSTLTVVAVGLVLFYFCKIIKKRINLWVLFACYLLSLITYIFYNRANWQHLIYYVLLGSVCLFVFIVVMQVLALRKNCFKLTLDETLCFLFTVALMGVGLSGVQIFNVEIYRFVLMLAIFVCIAIGSHALTFSITLSFSLGVALSNFSIIPVAEFALLALLGCVFSMPQKYRISLMAVAVDLFLQFYFFGTGFNLLYQIIPIVLAAIVFVLIPRRAINGVADFVYVKRNELTSRNLINTTRKSIRRRLSELSNIFADMKQIHLKLVKKQLTKEQIIAMLTREVMSSCCKDCLDKNRCTRSLMSDSESNLTHLIEIAVTKGKITLLDIPSGLTNRCAKVNQLISLINRLSDEYKQYKGMVSEVNNVKLLLADQMGAVSRLLLDVGEEVDKNVSFDLAKENQIISKLLSINVECTEVLLYNEQQDTRVVLILKGQVGDYTQIEKAVSNILRLPMQVDAITPMEEGGLVSITLKKCNKYDCVFGLASCNKAGNEECGDCHSIIRLSKDRFLLALCDGMGSGKTAHNMSAVTLSLIENFYKVGFDNDIVLESVNKLLAINNQENYSTLDICLLDLNRQIADIIKVGSPYGVIKRDTNIELVEGGALPIGALDSINPSTYKTTISTKDIVIMATDGVTDAFVSQENFIEYVSKLASNNPQTLAESILNEALRLNNMSARDDMTVLVARTYLKNVKDKK